MAEFGKIASERHWVVWCVRGQGDVVGVYLGGEPRAWAWEGVLVKVMN